MIPHAGGMNSTSRNVVIVGAGSVGATFAYALAQSNVAQQIALLDANRDLAEGQVLDLAHGLPFVAPVTIKVGDVSDYRDANVIVITAGARQQAGESRLALLQRNTAIVESIMDSICEQESNAIVVVVSNPVDILTHVAQRRAGWPRGRIFGSGTVLDSARFRYLLSRHCGVDVRNVHAYILGEHGDSEFAAWSMTHVAGMPIDTFCPICRDCANWVEERKAIVEQVRHSAYHIIGYKGSTYFAVGLALVRIVGAIMRDEHSVLTVSTELQGEYGVEDVCLSLPCIVTANGVERIVTATLGEEENGHLAASAAVLRKTLADLHADC